MRRIGVLVFQAADERVTQARIAAFIRRLKEFGWTDGDNVRIEYRWAAGETGQCSPIRGGIGRAHARRHSGHWRLGRERIAAG